MKFASSKESAPVTLTPLKARSLQGAKQAATNAEGDGLIYLYAKEGNSEWTRVAVRQKKGRSWRVFENILNIL